VISVPDEALIDVLLARGRFRDVATRLSVEHQSGHEVVAAATGVNHQQSGRDTNDHFACRTMTGRAIACGKSGRAAYPRRRDCVATNGIVDVAARRRDCA
jgi:hypothetical protein